MKQHALITEIQLGKSPEELCKEHFDKYEFTQDLHEYLPDIVMGLVKLKKPLNIAVTVGGGHCGFLVLSTKNTDLQKALDKVEDFYFNDDYPLDDDAHEDCGFLNDIVKRFFAWNRKKRKPKISSEEYAKDPDLCPFCLKRKPVTVLDDVTWNRHDIMGCRSCGETWNKDHKKVITGFSGV